MRRPGGHAEAVGADVACAGGDAEEAVDAEGEAELVLARDAAAAAVVDAVIHAVVAARGAPVREVVDVRDAGRGGVWGWGEEGPAAAADAGVVEDGDAVVVVVAAAAASVAALVGPGAGAVNT